MLQVVGGADRGDGGISHGGLLVRLCEAMFAEDPEAIAEVRAELVAAMSEAAFVDAVAVGSLFYLMTRVASGTGTPLDSFMLEPAGKVADLIGANQFASRSDTPTS